LRRKKNVATNQNNLQSFGAVRVDFVANDEEIEFDERPRVHAVLTTRIVLSILIGITTSIDGVSELDEFKNQQIQTFLMRYPGEKRLWYPRLPIGLLVSSTPKSGKLGIAKLYSSAGVTNSCVFKPAGVVDEQRAPLHSDKMTSCPPSVTSLSISINCIQQQDTHQIME
jgi:hypothetical protein